MIQNRFYELLGERRSIDGVAAGVGTTMASKPAYACHLNEIQYRLGVLK